MSPHADNVILAQVNPYATDLGFSLPSLNLMRSDARPILNKLAQHEDSVITAHQNPLATDVEISSSLKLSLTRIYTRPKLNQQNQN